MRLSIRWAGAVALTLSASVFALVLAAPADATSLASSANSAPSFPTTFSGKFDGCDETIAWGACAYVKFSGKLDKSFCGLRKRTGIWTCGYDLTAISGTLVGATIDLQPCSLTPDVAGSLFSLVLRSGGSADLTFEALSSDPGGCGGVPDDEIGNVSSAASEPAPLEASESGCRDLNPGPLDPQSSA